MTRILAALAFALSVLGIIPAVQVVRADSGSALDGRVLWALVPILSTAGVCLLASRPRLEPIWLLTGTCWGFVVLGAWSLGLFFAPAALLLLFAAGAHVATVRLTWRAFLIPAWFLAGASGVSVLFLARDEALAMSRGGPIMVAPVIVAGLWVFAVLVVFLVVATQASKAASWHS
jgi:hypothetical protein